MRRATPLEDRKEIVTLARAGHWDRAIAAQLGWSLSVVRKWRRRGQRGREALYSRMGRPATGALGTFPAPMRQALRDWRTAHPGWGPKTLRAQLATEGRFCGEELPSLRSIARFLSQEGLTRAYQRHSELPATSRAAPQAAHEEWEMDARGYQLVPEVGLITLINLNDRYSHVRLLSYPCSLGRQRVVRHPTTEDYQAVLRLCFTQWGLPERIAVDHESVFYDNLGKSPFPTRLHLWLLALGVALLFGRPGRPTDQGMTERSHQLWAQQVLQKQRFADWNSLYHALEQRRDFLNYHLPCASLGELPPLMAHPEALGVRRPYRPEWEAELLDLGRVHRYLAQGQWFRLASNIGAVSLGCQRYALGKTWARQQAEITFDAPTQEMIFVHPDGTQVKRLPLKGLSREALMGELGPLVNLPLFQLALPMSWDEFRVTRLSGTLVSQLIDT